jgi:hypothetical protein
MTQPELTITTEQVNSLPLLLGIINDMGIRDLIDTHIHPHGNWEGASVGTVLSIWLSHILQQRDHTMVSVRDWAAERLLAHADQLTVVPLDIDPCPPPPACSRHPQAYTCPAREPRPSFSKTTPSRCGWCSRAACIRHAGRSGLSHAGAR